VRAAPRAESGSLPESRPKGTTLSRFPATRRLRSPAQFMAVTSDPHALRATRRWLALAGRLQPAGQGTVPVRFGMTAARRYARRAVDRNAVKRVLREAARARIEELDAAAGERAIDIVLRLRAVVPGEKAPARRAWKEALRREADALLIELAGRLRHQREAR